MQRSSVRSRCLRVRNESDEDERMWHEPPRKRTGRNPGNNRVGGGHQELLAIVRGLQRSNILRGESQVSLSFGSKPSKLRYFLNT